jgi:hypothetical protein
MSDSDEDGSVPPDVQGDAVDAAQLPQAAGAAAGPPPAAPQHPVWAAAAGAGRGANKNKPDSMYKPISMMELEIRGRGDLDGGSSTASVRGDSDKKRRHKGEGERKEKKRARPREYDDEEEDCADDAASSASADVAGAAFGGATAKPRFACPSEASDDGASDTSSVARRRRDRAFPITGVTCVGCALPARIQPVTDFIAKNMSTMAELALYKMAALVYKTKVAEPAEEEGVDVPEWDWKELRAHYQLHSVDPRMHRYENIRTLSAMRKTLEMQLLRCDPDTGEQTLDKHNAESIMKVIQASSRELTLLAEVNAGARDANTGKKRGA